MANKEHINILFQGVDVWNKWRKANPDIVPDLIGASLIGADLKGANLDRAYLGGADLSGADLRWADLNEAELNGAYLSGANLSAACLAGAEVIGADIIGAHLIGASLTGADLYKTYLNDADLSRVDLSAANLSMADLSGANLVGSNLKSSIMIETCLCGTDLTGSCIYGISAWNIKTDENTKQNSLTINKVDESTITVDNLEVAQFIYLMLNSKKIRDVINTMTSKVVLILGRFSDDRKIVLDSISEELKKHDYVPIMMEFDRPDSRDFTETVTLLARMAKFIIVDLTAPKSAPHEMANFVKDLPSVPVQIIASSIEEKVFSMIEHYEIYECIIKRIVVYQEKKHDQLVQQLKEKIINPCEQKLIDLMDHKTQNKFVYECL